MEPAIDAGFLISRVREWPEDWGNSLHVKRHYASHALSIPRLRFEVEEFLASCEQDLGYASGTTTFYRKKFASLVAWAEANHTQGLDAQGLREFFRHLKTTGLSETTRHGHFRAIRVFLNFLVRRKIIKHSPLWDADIRIRQRWKRPELPNA